MISSFVNACRYPVELLSLFLKPVTGSCIGFKLVFLVSYCYFFVCSELLYWFLYEFPAIFLVVSVLISFSCVICIVGLFEANSSYLFVLLFFNCFY